MRKIKKKKKKNRFGNNLIGSSPRPFSFFVFLFPRPQFFSFLNGFVLPHYYPTKKRTCAPQPFYSFSLPTTQSYQTMGGSLTPMSLFLFFPLLSFLFPFPFIFFFFPLFFFFFFSFPFLGRSEGYQPSHRKPLPETRVRVRIKMRKKLSLFPSLFLFFSSFVLFSFFSFYASPKKDRASPLLLLLAKMNNSQIFFRN